MGAALGAVGSEAMAVVEKEIAIARETKQANIVFKGFHTPLVWLI